MTSGSAKWAYLWELFGNVTAHKHSLQIDPQVLHNQPVLNDLGGASQLLHPLLDLGLEGSVVSDHREKTYSHSGAFLSVDKYVTRGRQNTRQNEQK